MAQEAPERSLVRAEGGLRKSKPKALTTDADHSALCSAVDERALGLTAPA
jgi:hypothetical protein